MSCDRILIHKGDRKMGVIEKYSRSINSSNLRSDELHYEADSLAAVAMVDLSTDGLGGLLFRVKYGNDATSHNTLLMTWKDKVARKAELRQWPRHITARKVAEISLSYWLNDMCEACEGRGYEMLPNSPVLSDVPCKCCKGEKTKPLIVEHRLRDYVLDMIEDLEEMAHSVAGAVMKRLARDMEI